MEFIVVASAWGGVGEEVEMRFRIKEIDRARGYRHYFWKATPVPALQTAEAAA